MKRKAAFIFIILLITVFGVAAEEKRLDSSSGSRPKIDSIDISPNPVGKGDLFTLTITVDYDDPEAVEVPLKELPPDILLWRGPYIRSFIDEDKKGDPVRKTRISVTFKAQSAGRMIFPSLSVFVENRQLKTEPQLLKVGLYSNRKLYIPLEVEWKAGFDKIYQGEAVPIFLEVKNQELVVIFDRTRIALPREGFFEKASGIGQITSKREGNIVLYDIPAETFIYTAHVPGRITIPSSGVDYDGITGWTNNLVLNVERTPPAISETGAIGSFRLSSSVDKKEAEAGKLFELTLTIEGSGNLNYLQFPEPSAEGCLLVSSEESKSYVPSLAGFTGSRTMKWLFESDSEGTAELKIPEFRYLNKQTDQVESYPEKEFTVSITAPALSPAEEKKVVFPFEKVEISDPSVRVWKNSYRLYYRYVWILPALVFFLLVKIMRGKKIGVAVILTVIILSAVISVGRFSLNLKPAEDNSPATAAELYNASVDAWGDGRLPECLHDLRTAIYLDPVNSQYREVLSWVEAQSGFVTSVQPAIRIHPDIFYYILMVSFNLCFLAAAFGVLRRGAGNSVMIILFAFTALLSASLIAYSHASRLKLTGIIYEEECSLKKIPQLTAENWVRMDAGTAVKLLETYEGFTLVETGMGIKGWIDKDCILADRPDGSEY